MFTYPKITNPKIGPKKSKCQQMLTYLELFYQEPDLKQNKIASPCVRINHFQPKCNIPDFILRMTIMFLELWSSNRSPCSLVFYASSRSRWGFSYFCWSATSKYEKWGQKVRFHHFLNPTLRKKFLKCLNFYSLAHYDNSQECYRRIRHVDHSI